MDFEKILGDKEREVIEHKSKGFYSNGLKIGGISIGGVFLDKLESVGSIPEKELIDLQQLQCELFLLSLIGD